MQNTEIKQCKIKVWKATREATRSFNDEHGFFGSSESSPLITSRYDSTKAPTSDSAIAFSHIA